MAATTKNEPRRNGAIKNYADTKRKPIDTDKVLTRGIRTLREAKATWKNFSMAPNEVGVIVGTQLRLLARQLEAQADEISKTGGGR